MLIPLVFALTASASLGQSITAGGLHGVVRDTTGSPILGARVSVVGRDGRTRTAAPTSRDGAFSVSLLPSGEYDVIVEALGYRPCRVRAVPVRPANTVSLQVSLAPAAPPVMEVDTIAFIGARSLGSAASRDALHGWAADQWPAMTRDVRTLGVLETRGGPTLGLDGLPGAFTRALVDGVPFARAQHPGIADLGDDLSPFPIDAIGSAEIVTAGSDVEWSGGAGGYLSAHAIPGGRELRIRGFADWTGDQLSDSRYFDTGATPNRSTRAGVTLAGPIVRDTVTFSLGVEVERVETPLPPVWRGDSVGLAVAATARDSFGVDLADRFRPALRTAEAARAFGRFDWQLARGHDVTVHAGLAVRKEAAPSLGDARVAEPGAELEARDLAVGATLTSVLSSSVSHELRLGFADSRRDYTDGTAATTFVDGSLGLGAAGMVPGQFRRSTLWFGQALHWSAGRHRFKVGSAFTLPHHDITYAEERAGAFFFGGPEELAARRGVFRQAVGALPVAEFAVPQAAFFVQDKWSAAPGLSVWAGARVEIERLPVDDVRRNDALGAATGLDNTNIRRRVIKWSPRFGVTWDVGERQQWALDVTAGVHQEQAEAGLVSQVIAYDGAVQRRLGVGALGDWPGVPDSNAAPVQGPLVALLGPSWRPARSTRLAVGISRAIGAGAAIRVTGTYRHTDFLTRRHDLNLLPAPAGADQYGRPVYGTLDQQGSLLAAVPGSNRRFDGFAAILALDPDGYSDYYGLTLTLTRRSARGLNLLASYTRSRTTDNWLGARAGDLDAQLSPFPDSLAGVDWSDGRSDFDVPHRLVVGAELRLGGRFAPRLAALYRYRSGWPFTPGFRAGVDANADGSMRNDPAYVDDQVPGVMDLAERWDCLRTQVGSFAERNSCREPGVHTVDLRFAMRLVRLRGVDAELIVDALNAVESEGGIRDQALYLVDENAAVVVDSATGGVVVPLLSNPSFGRLLVPATTGRSVRIGLRIQ